MLTPSDPGFEARVRESFARQSHMATLNVTIAQLKAAKYGLNGHKSAAEIGTYTFCGNLPR